MELVLFKDLLEDDAESQYGLLEDRDEPSVICLCCGSTVEFGDYEILERLPWQDISTLIKQNGKNKFTVCMDSSWVRDAQYMYTSDLSEEKFEGIEINDECNEHRWRDMEPIPYIGTIEADSEEDACRKIAKQKRYDCRCLFAIKN